MPEGVEVLLSVVVDRTLEQSSKNGAQPMTSARTSMRKQGLHVQSRSHWCPANIGPYSQAIFSPSASKVYIAGQIPLIPSTMEVYNPFSSVSKDLDLANQSGDSGLREAELKNFHTQACLSLEHLWRVGRERGVRWWEGMVVYIAASPSSHGHASDPRDSGNTMKSKARIAFHLHKQLHDPTFWDRRTSNSCNGKKCAAEEKNSNDENDDEDDDFDIWHHTHNSTYKSRYPKISATTSSLLESNILPDFDFPSQRRKCFEGRDGALQNSALASSLPAFLAVEVAELPMSVGVEWQAVGFTGCAAAAGEEGQEEDDDEEEREVRQDNHKNENAADNNLQEETDKQTPTTLPEWITQIASHPCFRHKILLLEHPGI